MRIGAYFARKITLGLEDYYPLCVLGLLVGTHVCFHGYAPNQEIDQKFTAQKELIRGVS